MIDKPHPALMPGSAEAIAAGCTCVPAEWQAQAKDRAGAGARNRDCPLHGQHSDEADVIDPGDVPPPD